MDIQRVSSVFFSATGTTKRAVSAIAKGTLLPRSVYEISHLYNIPDIPAFGESELVIIGAPVYVGRVPKVLLPIFNRLKGNNTPCIIVGVYGNRHYDDFLAELEDIVRDRGFAPVGGAVFVGEHSFSRKIAANRPNESDLALAEEFGASIAEKLSSSAQLAALPLGALPGNRPYREPYGGGGKKASFGPSFMDSCSECGLCAQNCPSGAIVRPKEVIDSKCILCYACVRNCSSESVKFVNEQFLSHVRQLEDTCTKVNMPEFFA